MLGIFVFIVRSSFVHRVADPIHAGQTVFYRTHSRTKKSSPESAGGFDADVQVHDGSHCSVLNVAIDAKSVEYGVAHMAES